MTKPRRAPCREVEALVLAMFHQEVESFEDLVHVVGDRDRVWRAVVVLGLDWDLLGAIVVRPVRTSRAEVDSLVLAMFHQVGPSYEEMVRVIGHKKMVGSAIRAMRLGVQWVEPGHRQRLRVERAQARPRGAGRRTSGPARAVTATLDAEELRAQVLALWAERFSTVQMSEALGVSVDDVRRCLREMGVAAARRPRTWYWF